MGTRYNRLSEAVLTCIHNLCFEQKYENSQIISTENCHLYSREKSLYVAWAFFRNVSGFNEYQQHMSPGVRKPTIWILTRSDTNQAVQPLKMARGWKF